MAKIHRDTMKKTIVFDFDGVIHSYTSRWQGMAVAADPPVEGVKDLIDMLRSSGYEVAVQSTRCADPAGFIAVNDYLTKYGIQVDILSATKPPAIVYIDDRGMKFTGPMHSLEDVKDVYSQIVNFKPWNK